MEIPVLLIDAIVILGLAIVVVFIGHLVRLPFVVGLLITGLLAGPNGLSLIHSRHEVEVLSEIGVIFLLFIIGIEFSLKDLWKMKRSVLLGGSIQVFLTMFVFAALANQCFSFDWNTAIFVGMLLTLSSTAIVLKLLKERAEIESPMGKNALSILIFQDIAVVPMIIILPILAGNTENVTGALAILLGKSVLVVALTLISALYVVPHLLHHIAKTRNRELFLLTIVFLGFGIALLTNKLGLSIGLGAFLAGLIISESEYANEALAGILPFSQVFIAFFFVSIGMLLDFQYLLNHSFLVMFSTIAVMLVKFLIIALAVLALGFPLRVTICTGLCLAQIGEFSFVLANAGVKQGISLGDKYQLFLSISVVSMVLTPFLIAAAPQISTMLMRFPFPKKWKKGYRPLAQVKKEGRQNHIIIVGFGLNGQNLAHAATIEKIPYVILEMNPGTVRQQKSKGEPIFYGDATHEHILEHAELHHAKVLVCVISDPLSTRKIVTIARKLNPHIYIIARTRFVTEMEILHKCGANEVVPEEFETSVEIFTRVLRKFLIPENKISDFTHLIRANGYKMLRETTPQTPQPEELKMNIPELEIHTYTIPSDSLLTQKNLAQLNLKKKCGVTILVVKRGDETISELHGDTALQEEDIMVITGNPSKLDLLLQGE